ncbi:transcriptional repressor [Candidatus Woesearchaeota archaeon]|nr:transcriptional repressor [Candidatus Woesearchaeota archaeon]
MIMTITMPSIRITTQKIKILEYLWSVNHHPTADEIYSEVKKDLPAISLATVYRNLHSLAEEGDIQKIEVNKEFRFDGDISPHQHCVCKKCGNISEIFSKDIARHSMQNAETEDFEPHSVKTIFHGICRECK